mgnify:FL=1
MTDRWASVFPYKWKAFLAVALSLVTMVMSMSITILALPVIALDFEATLREVTWVVLGFSLTVTSLLLPMGRLSDLIGRKVTLLCGLSLFGVGCLACYWTNSLALLVAGRVVMGIGAAMGQGVGTAIVVSVFPPEERGKAIGSHTTAVAIGGAAGPVIAGLLLQHYPWQVLFLVMAVPAGLALIWGFFILEDEKIGSFQSTHRNFDLNGACLSALVILVFVISINSPFPSQYTLWMLGLGLPLSMVLLSFFIRHENRVESPLLDLQLFTNPVFSYAALTRIFGFMSRAASMLLLPVFLLNIRGINEWEIGLMMLVAAVGMGIGAQSGGRLSDHYGPRRFMIFGFLVAICSTMVMAFFHRESSVPLILGALFVNGIAMGLWATPNQVMTMNATPRASYGPVGALVNLTRNTGNVTGQAIVAAVMTGVMSLQGFNIELSQVGILPGSMEAFLYGWRVSYFMIIGFISIALLGAFLSRSVQQPGLRQSF